MLDWLNGQVGRNIDSKILADGYHCEAHQHAKKIGLL